MRIHIGIILALAVHASAYAQNVKNPSTLLFTASVDHSSLSSYEVDIKRASDSTVVSFFDIGKPTPNTDGVVTYNIQPRIMSLSFGTYFVVVRAVAGALKSADSNVSNNLDRVPGPPSSTKVQ